MVKYWKADDWESFTFNKTLLSSINDPGRDDLTNEYLGIVFQHGGKKKILHLSEIMVDNSLINSLIFHSLKIP